MDDAQRHDQLRVSIEYAEFLGAQQLAEFPGTLDHIYSNLYAALSGAPFPLPPEARLRVQESRTGNSIELHFIEGIGQIWGQMPTIEVGVSLGILPSMAKLILRIARRLRGVGS